MLINNDLTPRDLLDAAKRTLELGAEKVRLIAKSWDPAKGAPVFTVDGKYSARGWTEWTQGFQFGNAVLAFDGTGDEKLLKLGRDATVAHMASHVTHTGVHDHGFNNLSTYGQLRRLMHEGRIPKNDWERHFYELAIKASACTQAARWSPTADGYGYIYSFNGPHSLFIDTMRSLRILGVAHQLGHRFMGEGDKEISLLGRLVQHGLTTAKHLVWYGQGRDQYDIKGRTAHEGIFNRNDGQFRCPSSQQGYSPFSTWTRGLAWAILGFSEQLEYLESLPNKDFPAAGLKEGKPEVIKQFRAAAEATAEFWIRHASAADGVPYWDTGAPELHKLGDWRTKPADPNNHVEPVDSSAAVIAAQGMLRLGRFLGANLGKRYTQAGLTMAKTVLAEPYLSIAAGHQGLILHSVYHRPNAWDHVPAGGKIPRGESSMWGDYHAMELAVYLQHLMPNKQYLTFFA